MTHQDPGRERRRERREFGPLSWNGAAAVLVAAGLMLLFFLSLAPEDVAWGTP